MASSTTFASISAFVTAYSQSDVFGKLIFLGLIFLSIICWIVLIHKTWLARKVKKISAEFQLAFDKNKELLFSLNIDELPRPQSREVPHPLAKIFQDLQIKTMEILNKNHFFANQAFPQNHQGKVIFHLPTWN